MKTAKESVWNNDDDVMMIITTKTYKDDDDDDTLACAGNVGAIVFKDCLFFKTKTLKEW